MLNDWISLKLFHCWETGTSHNSVVHHKDALKLTIWLRLSPPLHPPLWSPFSTSNCTTPPHPMSQSFHYSLKIQNLSTRSRLMVSEVLIFGRNVKPHPPSAMDVKRSHKASFKKGKIVLFGIHHIFSLEQIMQFICFLFCSAFLDIATVTQILLVFEMI